MINLYKLEVFALVAQETSFSRAADRLYMTQSAVSQHIRDLETNLGTDLFIRRPSGIELTAAGRRLLEMAQKILVDAAAVEAELTQVANLKSGTLQLGAVPHAAAHTLAPWLQRFARAYPNLTVMVDPQPSAEQLKEIHAGTEDLAFLDHDPHDPQITTRLLPASGLLLAVGRGHPWAGKGEISIQQLNEQPFISLPVSHQMHTWSTQFFTHHHVEPDFLGEFPTPVDLVRALNANEAAAFLPAWVIRQNETLRGLEIVEAPELRRDLVLAWRTKMPIRPLARAFMNILEEDLPPQF